jgi:ABC-type hemin transport system ATPase subunit
MSGTPLIEAQHLSKSFRVLRKKTGALAGLRTLFSTDYQEVPAVNDVNFTIAPGELVGYIGPNGAGKSTTIKIAHSGQCGGCDRPGAAWPGDRAVPKDGATKQTLPAKPSALLAKHQAALIGLLA